MTLKTFSTTLDEVLGLVEPAVAGIEQGKGAAELLELEQLLGRALVDLLRLIRRDPGIEAATWDLYGAAVALVRDHGAGELPMARKQRLLREAHRRFHERLGAACPSEQGIKLVWREPAWEDENRSRVSALCPA
jgi:hypothetical protein